VHHPHDDRVYARRSSRVAFGLVLGAGAAVLAAIAVGGERLHAVDRLPLVGPVIATSWLLAFAVAALVRRSWPSRPACGSRLAIASVVAPGVGAALLLPLTVHAPFVLAIGFPFDAYASWSLVFFGHVHVVAAVLIALRLREIALGREVGGYAAQYMIVVATSLLPGMFLFFLPTLVVLATGIPIVIAMMALERMAEREWRDRGTLPGATLRVRRG
jgi:hypothetical protein